MQGSPLLTVFVVVFLAELGDKTQLATLLFSARAEPGQRVWIFAAAALALVAASALGVLGGAVLARWLPEQLLTRVGGVAFVLMGAWMLWRS